jgi:probable HAF family extracellular repeat protein
MGAAKLTWTLSGATYTYNLSLTNTGRLPIESFWFAGDGMAQKNLLPLNPATMGSAAGWYPTVGHKGTTDGYSILWRTATALAPGATVSGFKFTTTATPPQVLGASTEYPTLPVLTSFVYIGQPAGDPGYLSPVSHVAIPAYTLDVVGLLAPNTNSVANDLNDSGELVGGAEASSGGVTHAFMWTASEGLVDLGAFGSTLSASATSVNNGGVIAGEITLFNGSEDYSLPFVIGGGFPQKPGLPPNCDSVIVDGITNSGKLIVEGQLSELGVEDSVGAFAYTGGKYTAIGETAGTGQFNQVHDFHKPINAVYGYLGSSTSNSAVYWKWVDGSLSVFDWTAIYKILSGVSYYNSGANGEWLGTLTNGHAGYVSADGSKVTDLGFAGAVTGLNANGQAVGNYSPDGGYHQYGFYWSASTGFLNLNQLIDPSLGMTIVSATHINSNGQIAVQTQNPKVGTDYYLGVAGLLTPKLPGGISRFP